MTGDRVRSLYACTVSIDTPYRNVQTSGTNAYRTGQVPYKERTKCVQKISFVNYKKLRGDVADGSFFYS